MYLSHFGLSQAPFGITPNPAFFYSGNRRGAILQALIYAVEHGEGIVKVTGEVGSGKTMLCRMLESMLPSHIEIIYLVNPTLGRDEVVYAIASELKLDTRGKRPDEVIRALQNDLIAKHSQGKQVVLLVEEAQAMPLDTLEEIRLFSNLETAHHKLLQIVLFGQPELDENLSLPRMRQLKERITHSFQVPVMETVDIPDYLMFRMRAAGYRGPDIFTKGAVRHLAAVSRGIVRRISILADKSLLAAFAEDTHAIEVRHVLAAVKDSEFSFSATALRSKQRSMVMLWTLAVGAALAVGWLMGQHRIAHIPAARAMADEDKSGTSRSLVQAASTALSSPAQLSTGSQAAEKPAYSGYLAQEPNAFEQRLKAAQAWLKSQPSEHYTVQVSLIEAGNPDRVERVMALIESRVGDAKAQLFPTQLNGNPSVGIILGSFANRADALDRIEKLSRTWNYRPQLRTIQGIRQEMARNAKKENIS